MSFHGGLLGVMIALAIFAVRRKRRIADVFDFAAPLPGIGLCAGRIGNFINGELWGKPTDVPWGFMVDGEVPLHATQLYEAALEGVRAVPHPVVVHGQAAAAHGARGPVPHRLFAGAHHGRILARAGLAPEEAIGGYLVGHWFTMGMLLRCRCCSSAPRSCSWPTGGVRPRAISPQCPHETRR